MTTDNNTIDRQKLILEKIQELKMLVVKSQCFKLAAALRDFQKEAHERFNIPLYESTPKSPENLTPQDIKQE